MQDVQFMHRHHIHIAFDIVHVKEVSRYIQHHSTPRVTGSVFDQDTGDLPISYYDTITVNICGQQLAQCLDAVEQSRSGFAGDGVLAYCIAPGFTNTEMVSDSLSQEEIAKVVSDIPLGDMAPPEEIGALAAFLASDHVRHMTCATFDVNGASYVR